MIRFYLLLFFIQLLVAQQLNEYSLRNLTVRNGISQNSINVILQDSKGFLWLGTRAGLNRYNAYNFEEFKHIPFDSNSLVDSHINEIFEDQNGRIWLGTSGGLDLFDFAKRQFIHIKTEIDSANSRRRIIHTINEDMNGNLWIGTSAGLLVMNSDRQIRTFYKENGDLAILSSAVVTDLSIQSDILWIGTLNGLFQMNLTSAEIKSFKTESDNFFSLSSNQVNEIYQDPNGITWIATDLGLNRYNQFEERFYGYFYNIEDSNSLSSDYITGLSSDQNGRMWITTRNGLNIYQSSTDEFQRYHFDLTVRNEFRPFDFNDVLVDRLGTVWLASVENGLIQLIPHFQTFRLYNSANQPQLSSNQMTSVYLDRFSRLWVGTNYGLNLVDRNRTHVEHFFEQPFSNRSISNDYIIDIEGDGMGRVWLATRNGLNYYDEKQSRFRQFKANDPFFTKIEDIELFDEKQIWVAGELGVAIINTIDLTKNAIETLKNIHASQLLFDTKQRLWIGQESQLLVYHVKSDSTAVYHHSPERNSISNDHILSLHEDGFGRIWIGTRAGLNRYREDSNDFEFIEEVVQLADDQIYWIESEKNGNLWVSTNKGLTRIVYSADQVQIKNFDSDDGLQNFAFNSSGFRTQTGELFFGGNNGLNSFYPGQIQDRPYQVPNIIESIVTNNRTIYLDINKVSDQVITLDYEDQVITFNFTSLDYINPDKNQYQYILENVDNEWIQAGKTHSVSYSNLLSGTYRFRFKGSNSSFNWNQTGASVTIVIKPPYWNSWWFSSLIALALFLVLFTFLYNRFKRLQEIREIRGRIARDLHDDIGASLTEVTLMSELAQQLNDKGQLNTVLAKIEDVTRGLVSSLGDLVWSIDTKNESLDSLLLRMKDFASDLLSRRDIGIEYQILGIKSNQKIDHHLKQTVYLIFKEAINNVVKHSTAKNVSVELRDDGKQFNLIIEDDGDGFDLNSEQTGNGLNNMKIRAKRVGGSVEFSIRKGLRIHLKTSALTK